MSVFDNKSHTHIIGVMWHAEYGDLVTFEDVVEEVKDTLLLKSYFIEEFGKAPEGFQKAVSLEKYMDRRVSTNLTRFEYCPFCGEKIDWKRLKEKAKCANERLDSEQTK